jgi:transposase
MGQRRKFSAEYKREAVAMLNAHCVSVSQIAAELGIGASVRRRWRRELRQSRTRRFQATGAHAMKNWPSC